MTDTMKTEYHPETVSRPGETLAETLEELQMSQAELARRMGRPTKTINEIVQGKTGILPETALQLENVLGIPASFWMAREIAYRTAVARSERRTATGSHGAMQWADRFPRREMAKWGWIRPLSRSGSVQELLEFFAVASPQAWESTWSRPEVAFRRSLRKDGNRYAVAAWLRRGEIVAAEKKTDPYDEKAFRTALDRCRELTMEGPERFCPRLQEMCAKAGVVVLFIPELPGAGVSGASRWLTSHRALIQLSLRFRKDDQLWFSFFHEAGHILLHSKKGIFIDDGRSTSTEEKEANAFASRLLIPDDAFQRLEDMHPLSTERVLAFAREQRIAPGIVVGRLQHEGLVPYTHLNGLKKSLAWSE